MLKVLTGGVLIVLSAAAQGQVIGGSDLVDAGRLSQLGTWLGEGPLQITNIFDKKAGDGKTSVDFHSAVDGQGRTFVVFRDSSSGYTFGGYDSASWDSSSIWRYDPGCFLFNFDLGLKIDKQPGYESTINLSNYGPMFGGGSDIDTEYDLESGFAYAFSYGAPQNIITGEIGQGYGSGGSSRTWSDIEVFTINQAPAPSGLALIGLGGLPAARRRRT